MLKDSLTGFAAAGAVYAIFFLSFSTQTLFHSSSSQLNSKQAPALHFAGASQESNHNTDMPAAGPGQEKKDAGEELRKGGDLIDGMPFSIRQCRKVLLDVGSGGGNMVQRLYDGFANKRGANAGFFSEAWREHFGLLFGFEDTRHHDVCAVLWEPMENPRLRKVVARYQSIGRKVHWFRRPAWTGATVLNGTTNSDTNMTFFYTAPRSFMVKKSSVVRWTYEGTLDPSLESILVAQKRKKAGGAGEVVVFNESLAVHDFVSFVTRGIDPDATVVLVMDNAGGVEHRLVHELVKSGQMCQKIDSLVLQHPTPQHMWMLEQDKTPLTAGDFYVLSWALHEQRCACKTVARMSLPFSWPFNKKAGEELGVGIFRCHLDSWKKYFYRGGRCLW